MIRVLHLIDTYRIGGPGKTIINSARYIDTGFHVHVGSFTSPQPGRDEFAAAVRAAGVPYLELRETRRVEPGHIGQIRRYVRQHDIRIVHAHGYRTDALTWLATRGLKTAFVTTHHGWIRNNPRQEAMARLGMQLSRLSDGLEVVSRRLLDEVPASLVRSGRVEVVHNAIVPEDYRPAGVRDAVRAELGASPGDVLLGVVGRLSVEKGCLEMMEAFAAVVRAQPAARLVFVGEGALLPALQEKAKAAGLDGRVHFAGYRSRPQPFYEAFDIVVSPSRTEGLPNALLEAMMLERPIVATAVGGTPELVEDGVSALLVEAERPAPLAAAIVRVIADPALARALVDGGTRRVQAEFTFPARMRKEEAFYRRVLARRRLDA